MAWSPFSWIFEVVSEAVWGPGLSPDETYPLGQDSRTWESMDNNQIQQSIAQLDKRAQAYHSLLKPGGTSADAGFQSFAFIASLSTAARMADWNCHTAAEVALRYKMLLWALQQPVVAKDVEEDDDVAAWKGIAEKRMKDLEANREFTAAVQEALSEFDEFRRRGIAELNRKRAGAGTVSPTAVPSVESKGSTIEPKVSIQKKKSERLDKKGTGSPVPAAVVSPPATDPIPPITGVNAGPGTSSAGTGLV